MMTGIWVCGAALLGVAFGWPGAALSLVLLPLVLVMMSTVVPNRSRLALLTILIVAASGGGAIRQAQIHDPPSLLPLGAIDRIEGTVASPVRTDLRYQRFDLSLSRVRSNGQWQPVDATIRVLAPDGPRVGYGDHIGASASLSPSEDETPASAGYLRNHDLSGEAFAHSIWINAPGSGARHALYGVGARLSDVLRRAVPGDTGVLLSGLATGDDTALSADTRLAFKMTGMSHITAVSGANLALIVTMLMTAGGAIGVQRRRGWLAGTVLAIWVYAAVTGFGPPVVRAALLASLALGALAFGRRADYLTAAFVTAAVMAVWDPRVVTDTGFQLSCAASVAIAARMQASVVVTPAGMMRAGLDATIVAQLATVPVMLATFGRMPLSGVATNLVVGPLVEIAFPVALVAAVLGLVWLPLAEAMAHVAAMPAGLVLWLIQQTARLPLTLQVPMLPGRLALLLTAIVTVLVLPATRDGHRWLARRRVNLVEWRQRHARLSARV